MELHKRLAFLYLLLSTITCSIAIFTPLPVPLTRALHAKGLANLKAEEDRNHDHGRKCTIKNAIQRKEWGSLKPHERKAYTNAVQCLQKKPSRYSSSPLAAQVPGAKTRFDDFTAVHMNLTYVTHGNANFLSWHRLYIWTYETALREECGYKGYQPYWDWSISALDPINSPVFDGSETSMGSNGKKVVRNCTQILPPPAACVPPGEGGGCVDKGPFKDYVLNLAPGAPSLNVPEINNTLPLYSYFPRCLRRDVSSYISSRWTKDKDVADVISNFSTIAGFQDMMQGGGFPNGYFGIHAGGHYTIGGDPGGDFLVSPAEPVFWLHHANIDRVWWIWQNQDLATRQYSIAGTLTFNNNPPSRDGRLDDWLDIGLLGNGTVLRDMMKQTAGPLCYIYV